jgi:hypothetical protein
MPDTKTTKDTTGGDKTYGTTTLRTLACPSADHPRVRHPWLRRRRRSVHHGPLSRLWAWFCPEHITAAEGVTLIRPISQALSGLAYYQGICVPCQQARQQARQQTHEQARQQTHH